MPTDTQIVTTLAVYGVAVSITLIIVGFIAIMAFGRHDDSHIDHIPREGKGASGEGTGQG